MGNKRNNVFWVLVALLSSVGVVVGFLTFNIHVIVFSAIPNFIAWCVVGSRLIDNEREKCVRGTTYYDILDRF